MKFLSALKHAFLVGALILFILGDCLVDQAVAGGSLSAWKEWLPPSASTMAPKIDSIFYLILGITGVVFVVVELLLIFFIFRYHTRRSSQAFYTHGNKQVEIIWTIVPALILVFLAFKSQEVWRDLMHSPIPSDALKVEVKAEQFAWNIVYAGRDGEFGTPDDIKKINQLYIPVGRPVAVNLTSIGKDNSPAVIHSFFIPEFRIKQDVVPGTSINIWFQATKTGRYEIACAEFCGLGHYRMRGFLTVQPPEEFSAWLEKEMGSI